MPNSTVSKIFSLTTKRVTDLVLEQSRAAFLQTGIALDAKMISIVTLIHLSGPLTSSTLSEKTGLSRQLVESRLRRLTRDNYLEERKHPKDLRKRIYSIAKSKVNDVAKAIELVTDFESVYEALWSELGVDLHQGIRDLESALHVKPLVTRLTEQKPHYLNQIREATER
jgi:DNA-binding MarR family transcriptional regulator